ncbi:hypothetical protein HPG69_013982, partial [Diceros bicornis minor]
MIHVIHITCSSSGSSGSKDKFQSLGTGRMASRDSALRMLSLSQTSWQGVCSGTTCLLCISCHCNEPQEHQQHILTKNKDLGYYSAEFRDKITNTLYAALLLFPDVLFPFLLMSRDSTVSKLCFVWIRNTKFTNIIIKYK